jgi:hypothetical protein
VCNTAGLSLLQQGRAFTHVCNTAGLSLLQQGRAFTHVCVTRPGFHFCNKAGLSPNVPQRPKLPKVNFYSKRIDQLSSLYGVCCWHSHTPRAAMDDSNQ